MTTTDASPMVEPLRGVLATPEIDRSSEGRAAYNPARALRIHLLRPVGKDSRRLLRMR